MTGRDLATTTINVPEVHCDHCTTSIEGALNPMEGVHSATVDLDEKSVAVDYDDAVTDLSEIVTAIEEQGYEVPAQT